MSTKFNPEGEVSLASWDYYYRSKNRYFELAIRRSTAIAFLISLVIHAVALFAFYPNKFVDATSVTNRPSKIISVRIAGLRSKKALPKISLEVIKPRSQMPPAKAVEKKAATASPQPVIKIPLIPDDAAPKDFMSYIKAKRQHSQNLEDNAARENANARAPSDEELRDANIKRNLQQQGTSGIFEIRQKTIRTARFSFKGWKNDLSIPRLEIIDVEAGADGDINLAIVKKMIEIIRREYKGNFNWESQRLGRVLVLSARREDNAGLEEFLIQEFFKAPSY